MMRRAIEVARAAGAAGEVPVGALLVVGDRIVSESGNDREATKDPLGHAELRVIAAAAKQADDWRLTDATLYVTLEPCPMCAGAIVAARIPRLVFGAWDARAGACGSAYNIVEDPRLNHRVEVTRGVLADECAALVDGFFQTRR